MKGTRARARLQVPNVGNAGEAQLAHNSLAVQRQTRVRQQRHEIGGYQSAGHGWRRSRGGGLRRGTLLQARSVRCARVARLGGCT